jgi:hypothetical protein
MIDAGVMNGLRGLYAGGNMTLFLGAGISMDNGLPGWKDLVVSMYFRYMADEEWRHISPYPNYLYAISSWYVQETGESLDVIVRKLEAGYAPWPGMFENCLWESLYGSYLNNELMENLDKTNPAVDAVAGLIMNAPGKVRKVITYNFDDVLETRLRGLGATDFETLYDNRPPANPCHVPIYHVHGYVPYSDDGSGQRAYGDIILSEADYNKMANDHGHWANACQQESLRNTTNLFVGMSLTDRNVRRILDMVRDGNSNGQNHIFPKRSQPPMLQPEQMRLIDDHARKLKNQWLQEGGVKPKRDLNSDITSILASIHTHYRLAEEKVLLELNMNPIWYDDHREVAEYLCGMVL